MKTTTDLDIALCELDMCKLLLREALPHVEGIAQAVSRGPMIGDVDRLAITIAEVLNDNSSST